MNISAHPALSVADLQAMGICLRRDVRNLTKLKKAPASNVVAFPASKPSSKANKE